MKIQRSRYLRALLRCVFAAACLDATISTVHGQVQYWATGTNGSPFGGTGTWDATTPNWFSSGPRTVYNQSSTYSASFQGPAGTVSLNADLPVGDSLIFVTGGYTLQEAAGQSFALTITNAVQIRHQFFLYVHNHQRAVEIFDEWIPDFYSL